MTFDEVLAAAAGDRGRALMLGREGPVAAAVADRLARLGVTVERDLPAGGVPALPGTMVVLVLDPWDADVLAALPTGDGTVGLAVVGSDPADVPFAALLAGLVAANRCVTGAAVTRVGDERQLVLVTGPVVSGADGDGPRVAAALSELEVARAVAAQSLAAADADPAAVHAAELPHAIARLVQERVRSERECQRLAREIDDLRSSVSWQLGRAVAEAVRDPRAGVPRLPGRLAAAVRSGSARSAIRAVAPGSSGPPRRRFALPVPTSPSGAVTTLEIDVPVDQYVPLRLERDGLAGYEPEALACYLAAIEVAGPGDVWDVGANVGIYALLARAASERVVHAFEPTADLADTAIALAGANGLPYQMHQVAAGSADGTATLYLSGSTDSSNSLAAGFREALGEVVVRVETLDGWSRRVGSVPAVIKIDTETTEPEVLAGAREVVREHRPWILCEVLANQTESRLTEVIHDWGYRWYPVRDDVPFERGEKIVGEPTFTQVMWLFAPDEPTERFWTAVRRWRRVVDACGPGTRR